MYKSPKEKALSVTEVKKGSDADQIISLYANTILVSLHHCKHLENKYKNF